MKPSPLLTPDQVAQRLQVARTTVLDLLRQRRLVGVKVGPQWRVEPAALDEFIAEQRQRPTAAPASGVPAAAIPSPLLGSAALDLMPTTRRFS